MVTDLLDIFHLVLGHLFDYWTFIMVIPTYFVLWILATCKTMYISYQFIAHIHILLLVMVLLLIYFLQVTYV